MWFPVRRSTVSHNSINFLPLPLLSLTADYARVILPNLNDYVNAVYVNVRVQWPSVLVGTVPY